MKKILYFRHSIKGSGPLTDFITEDGLAAAQKTAQRKLVDDMPDEFRNINHVFVGPLQRTAHTALAIILALGIKGKTHQVNFGVGTVELFNQMKGDGAKFFADVPYVDSMRYGLSAEKFNEYRQNSLKTVGEMFSLMADGEMGLAVGHSPVIELAAEGAGLDLNKFQLRENQSIIFTQDDGSIKAELP